MVCMARAPKLHPFDALAQHFARIVAENLQPLLAAAPQKRGPGRPKASGARPRRKIDMGCRYPGCKNRSKGPRFRFLCEEHLKLPKAEQNAALAKWEEKNG
jgi:hypothetical protein